MKKILSILAIIALLGISFNTKVLAAEPTILVSTSSAVVGKEAKVNISFSNNPGVAAFILSVDYDSSALELVSIDTTGISAGNWLVSGNNISWFNFGDVNFNGVFANVCFKVLKQVPGDFSPVTVSYSNGNIANYSEQRVNFKVNGGGVNISKATEEPTTEEKQEPQEEKEQEKPIKKDDKTQKEETNKTEKKSNIKTQNVKSESEVIKEDYSVAEEVEKSLGKSDTKLSDDYSAKDVLDTEKTNKPLTWLYIVIGIVVVLAILAVVFRDKIKNFIESLKK